MLGFLLQWPTLLTLAMLPVLVWIRAAGAGGGAGRRAGVRRGLATVGGAHACLDPAPAPPSAPARVTPKRRKAIKYMDLDERRWIDLLLDEKTSKVRSVVLQPAAGARCL
jgi:hypothetical protein